MMQICLLCEGTTSRYPDSSEKESVALSLPSPGSVTRGRSFPKIFYLYLAREILREDVRLEGWFNDP